MRLPLVNEPVGSDEVKAARTCSCGRWELRYSVGKLLGVVTWTSVWVGTWASIHVWGHELPSQIKAVVLLVGSAIIVVSPFAAFGVLVGRLGLGIAYGLIVYVLFAIMSFATVPTVY